MNPDKTFSCNKNGGNFSERVENTVGKREIALCEQFLLFHSNGIFKRLALQTHKNRGLSEKELKKKHLLESSKQLLTQCFQCCLFITTPTEAS